MAKKDKEKPADTPEAEDTAVRDEVTEAGETETTPEADVIEDAEILEDSPAEAETADTAERAASDETVEDEQDQSESDSADGADEGSDPVEELTESAADEPAPQVIRETVVEKKGGFVPMLLGGLLAGGIGFGVGQYGGLIAPPTNPFEAEARAALETQEKAIAGLNEGLENTQKALEIVNTAPLTAAVAGLEDRLAQTSEMVGGLSDQVAGFGSRMDAIEKQPLAGALSPEAIAAYERELEELRSSVAEQRSAMADVTASGSAVEDIRAKLASQSETIAALTARIDALATENAAAEAAAAEREARAASLVALADIRAALQNGSGFDAALSTLEGNGVAVPDALAAVSGGAPTQAALIEAFPDLARAALKEARNSGITEEGESGIATFFKNQLGARSVTPRDGDDPDAVLSRAEAAVGAGDLDAALGELSALPDGLRGIFDTWTAQADSRKAALAALDGLTQTVNQE